LGLAIRGGSGWKSGSPGQYRAAGCLGEPGTGCVEASNALDRGPGRGPPAGPGVRDTARDQLRHSALALTTHSAAALSTH
jgi:hypothetical protein